MNAEKIKETRTKLQKAFRLLRSQGFEARGNFMCCGNCATSALKLDGKKGGVYWHQQDDEGFKKDGHLYIGFCTPDGKGSDKVAEATVAALTASGVWAEWDGDTGTRILVKA